MVYDITQTHMEQGEEIKMNGIHKNIRFILLTLRVPFDIYDTVIIQMESRPCLPSVVQHFLKFSANFYR